jgi:DNA replication licensing factor MCM3
MSVRDQVTRMLHQESRRLIISLDELRSYNRELCDGLLYHPTEYIEPFNKALYEVAVQHRDPQRHVITDDTVFYVGFKGSFGGNL